MLQLLLGEKLMCSQLPVTLLLGELLPGELGLRLFGLLLLCGRLHGRLLLLQLVRWLLLLA